MAAAMALAAARSNEAAMMADLVRRCVTAAVTAYAAKVRRRNARVYNDVSAMLPAEHGMPVWQQTTT
jgi:hypothetical protein